MNENIITSPVFFLFIAFSFLLSFGYFRGRRKNQKIYRAAFRALVDTVKPQDQTFTVIGGVVGYHANLVVAKQQPISQIDATITLLPRHSWLYFPISFAIRRFDRLFVTFHCRAPIPGEGHIIEKGYAGFRGPKIANREKLQGETRPWGKQNVEVYYDSTKTRNFLSSLMDILPDPGVIRHIALVPGEQRCFVFMIPRPGKVEESFAPLYRWLVEGLKKETRHRNDKKS